MVTAFIDVNKDAFGVESICAVLSEHDAKFAPSTYYARKSRTLSARTVRDTDLGEEIWRVFHCRELGRGLAGARKVWRPLKREGAEERFGPIARCTVKRPMEYMGLQGMRRDPKRVRTSLPDGKAERATDLVGRDFTASAPNQLWVVDFTYVPTWPGMAFTAFVTDVCSRGIVGWRTASQMPTELPLDALEMARWTRAREGATDDQGRLEGLVQHSDAGSQYVAFGYTERLTAAGAVASIGTVGDPYDNALAESDIGLYKNERVKHDGQFHTVDDLELGTLSWVHRFNHRRLHSSIGYVTPMAFEQEYYRQNSSSQRPLPGELALH